MTKAAARARAPVEEAPVERDPIAAAVVDAQAARDRIAEAVASAEANRAEALRRIGEAEAAHEAAILSVRESSLALATDPVGDKLLDDATAAMMRADTRLKALRTQVLPAAERQVEERRVELAEADAVLVEARLSAEVASTVSPISIRIKKAGHELSVAFAEYQIARDNLSKFGQVYFRRRDAFNDRLIARELSPAIVRAVQAIHYENGHIDFPICASGPFIPFAPPVENQDADA